LDLCWIKFFSNTKDRVEILFRDPLHKGQIRLKILWLKLHVLTIRSRKNNRNIIYFFRIHITTTVKFECLNRTFHRWNLPSQYREFDPIKRTPVPGESHNAMSSIKLTRVSRHRLIHKPVLQINMIRVKASVLNTKTLKELVEFQKLKTYIG